VAQEIKSAFPIRYEALSSNPSTGKKKKNWWLIAIIPTMQKN
jgi:hypothetical protein